MGGGVLPGSFEWCQPQTLMTPSSPGSSPQTWHPVQQALPIGLPNDFETVRSEMYFLKTIVMECPKIDNLLWKRRPDSFGACRSEMYFLQSVVQDVQKWTIYRGNADPTDLELVRRQMLIENAKIRKPKNPAHRCPPSAPGSYPPRPPDNDAP